MRAVIVLCIVLAACKSDKSPPPARAGLAERVRDRIVAAIPKAVVTIRDPRTLHVKNGEIEIDMSLDNMEASCRGGEEVCNNAIDTAIHNINRSQDEYVVTPEQLVVTLKPKPWFDDTDKMLREKAADQYEMNKLISEAVAGDVVAVLASDHPKGIAMVSAGQLEKLKLDAKAAFDVARKNIAATHATLNLSIMEGTPVYTNDEDDNDIAATMLIPELWKPLAAKVKGDLLVAIPSRNRVFAAGSKDPGAVEGIAKIANVAFQTEDHPISTTIFKWSPTGWTASAIR